jgi:hypothetical protein
MHRVFGRMRASRATVAIAVLAFSLVGASVAIASNPKPAIQTITPHSENDITNIDVLRQQIRNYYGDPLGTGVFAPKGFYAREAKSVAHNGSDWLATARDPNKLQAIILDVDDTTLATWNYEVFSNWAYNPTTNAQFVTDQLFPAVPGMRKMVKAAAKEGYAIVFITGRPATQEADTLGNLTHDAIGVDANYPDPTTLPGPEDGLFTKPAIADYPPYLLTACAAELAQTPPHSCTTVHYKSATRAHIESLGYEIVANFGDQYSDLKGGHSDRNFKMPNPNYYLP